MEFFNIGAPELIIIVLIGLLLFGPEDLLKFARAANGYLRSAQRMWREVASQLEIDLTPPSTASPPEPESSAPTAFSAPEDLPSEIPPTHDTAYGP